MGKILIIDDDTYVCSTLQKFLLKHGYEADVAHTANDGLKALKKDHSELVLCDYRLPDADGAELFMRIRKLSPYVPVVFMTAYADVRTAVRMIRVGALDYVTKPFLPEQILKLVRQALRPGTDYGKEFFESSFVGGVGPAINNVLNHIKMVAPTDLSVLIQGETGSGKEYIARAIHYQSKRSDHPFVALDCGALPGELANSELFGHVKGAFTGAIKDKTGCFEQASGGSLFLDEIGNLTHANQVRLLRTLQEKTVSRLGDNKSMKVDVRIIVATNDDLTEDVKTNTFREDLYHRINGFTINLPPLRERKEDIFSLAEHFLHLANADFGKQVEGFDEEVRDVFLRYSWPGNIRELENVVTRCVLLTQGEMVGTESLPEEIRAHQPDLGEIPGMPAPGQRPLSLKQAAMIAERDAILNALKITGFNKSKAARLLEVDRKTLYNKMREYSIRIP